MAAVSITDILRGAEFAFEIYQMGWNETASTLNSPLTSREEKPNPGSFQ